MTSEKQMAANRRNAKKSTGPRTPEGKAKVARNALKHGLLSEKMLIMGERERDLKAFRKGMLDALEPEGELECLLADRVISAAWRLRRAVRMEREIVNHEFTEEISIECSFPGSSSRSAPTAEGAAASLMRSTDTYGKLSRYEAHIERGMYRALHELQRRQAARRGQQVSTPAALDVSVDVTGLPADGRDTDSAKQSHSGAGDDPSDAAEAPAAHELPGPDDGSDLDAPGSGDAS